MFFSQQGVTNDSFPCNTVAGSRIGGNSKERQRSSLCHEYHLFCVRQKELFKVAPAPFPLSTWGSTTPSVAVWAGKKRYFKLIPYKKIMKKMVQLMVKRKVVNQKLLKPGRSWRSLRAPVSTMSLPGVTPGSRWRNPLKILWANLFWISGRPAGPRRLLGLLLPLLLRGAALPDQQVQQHRTKPLATLPRY